MVCTKWIPYEGACVCVFVCVCANVCVCVCGVYACVCEGSCAYLCACVCVKTIIILKYQRTWDVSREPNQTSFSHEKNTFLLSSLHLTFSFFLSLLTFLFITFSEFPFQSISCLLPFAFSSSFSLFLTCFLTISSFSFSFSLYN